MNAKPTKVCLYCAEDLSNSEYVFCSPGCVGAYQDLESEWYVANIDGESYNLNKPRRKMYRATVSTYAGIVETFADRENAEHWVYNQFRGIASQGDVARSVRINLEKS